MDPNKRDHYAVPFETTATYTQRRELSILLEEKIKVEHDSGSVPCAVVLYGLGGAGKSQLALKYAEDHKQQYNPILWIDATNTDTIQSSFEKCAEELGIVMEGGHSNGPALAESKAVQGVLHWLRNRKETDGKWLTIVDNADDPSWGLKEIIPKGERGSIIITSRDSLTPTLVDGGCEQLEVGVMSNTEASSLLLQHLQWDLESAPEEILQGCSAVVQRLGHLALAVDLAGAYIGNEPDQERALIQYVIDYDKNRDELFLNDRFRSLLTTEKTVWTAWDTTLEKLEKDNTHLRPTFVLAFLARFKGGIIQDEMFRLASLGISTVDYELGEKEEGLPSEIRNLLQLNGTEWDSSSYRQSLDLLLRYSLVQSVDGEWPGVTMHGLVQWRMMQNERNRRWEWWYLLFVLSAGTQVKNNYVNPTFRRHFVVHIPKIAGSQYDGAPATEEASDFIYKIMSRVYYDEGRWDAAEELELQLVSTRKKILGADHPDVLTSMADLAATYWKQGRWAEAERLEIQVLEGRKKKLGIDHEDTLTSMGFLASTYLKQGRLDEAAELEAQVLEMSQKKLGSDHEDTLTSMANLAATYSKLGLEDKAEKLSIQAMECRIQKLGLRHADTLTSMSHLASTYRNQGKWKKSEDLEIQVLEVSKQMLGADHPNTLTSTVNLAATYRGQGRCYEAEKLLVKALDMCKKRLGEHHPDTITCMSNLASTYCEQDRDAKAKTLRMQVMEIRKKNLGPDHPDTLTSMGNLAVTYSKQQQWEAAEDLEVYVVETRKKKLGVDHFDTIISMHNLAFVWNETGREIEAIELMGECVQLFTYNLGAEHPHTLSASTVLSEWQKQHENATTKS